MQLACTERNLYLALIGAKIFHKIAELSNRKFSFLAQKPFSFIFLIKRSESSHPKLFHIPYLHSHIHTIYIKYLTIRNYSGFYFFASISYIYFAILHHWKTIKQFKMYFSFLVTIATRCLCLSHVHLTSNTPCIL